MRLIFGDKRLPARFWAKVHVDDAGCWLWTASLNNNGYGQFGVGRRTEGLCLAHRLALSVCEPLIQGLEVDHLCRKTRCCNPECLEQVTHRENLRRAKAAKPPRTHCNKGHLLDGYTRRDLPDGGWRCIICRREKSGYQGNVHNHEKTHCPSGHLYSGDNLYVCSRGKRSCRECARAAKRRYRARLKMAAQ